jgi:hypothetical protein
MKLYYHKTDGGAEYLMDKFITCPNGQREGIFKGAKIIVRIDGDIEKDAEYSIENHGICQKCGYNTLGLTNKELKKIK